METLNTRSARYGRDQDVITRRIAGEALLVPIRKRLADLDCVYVLHGVGEFLWDRLDGTRTVDDLAREVVERFVVGMSEASVDVEAFLGELTKAGLARSVDVS